MNLTGDGNGFDMVTMPQTLRERVPTANFFQQSGYERNPVARRTGDGRRPHRRHRRQDGARLASRPAPGSGGGVLAPAAMAAHVKPAAKN